MDNYKVKIDNVPYNVCVVYGSLKRKFKIYEGSNSGTAITGRAIRDIKGTIYSYDMEIEPNPEDPTAYDSFYQAITQPVDFHTVEFPYGQETLIFEAMITEGNDEYYGSNGNYNEWGKLQLNFDAMEPQRIS